MLVRRLRSLVQSRVSSLHEGQGFIEYALILAGVSAATQVAMQAMGQQVADVFNSVGDALRTPRRAPAASARSELLSR